MRKVNVTILLLLLSLFFILIFSMDIKADGTGTYPAPENGHWIIANETIVWNETIILNGNLSIENGGNLTFINVTLIMNCSEDGEFEIVVKNGGEFYIMDFDKNPKTIVDRSNITAFNMEFELNFLVESGSIFEMMNSELSECGYSWQSPPYGDSGLTIKTDNTIINNSTFYNNYIGIFIYESNNNQITMNNVISNEDHGIILSNSENNIIIRNNVISNNKGVYILNSNNNQILNNNITDNNAGIELQESSNNQINNNNVSKNSQGIFLRSSSDYNIIINNILFKNYIGIYLLGSSRNNRIINSTISSRSDYDFYIVTNSNITTINTTFDNDKVYFEDVDSKLIVKWFLSIKVVNQISKPVPGVNIRIKDNENGTYDKNYTTDIEGSVNWLNMTEYNKTMNNKIIYTPYNITADFGEISSLNIVNTNETKEIEIILEIQGIIYVDDDNTGFEDGTKEHPYNTIQEAVDISINGDTIRVFEGTYNENIVVDTIISIIGNGTGKTIINGEGSEWILTLNNETIELMDCTFTNARNGIRILGNNTNIINCEITEIYGEDGANYEKPGELGDDAIAITAEGNTLFVDGFIIDGVFGGDGGDSSWGSGGIGGDGGSGVGMHQIGNNSILENITIKNINGGNGGNAGWVSGEDGGDGGHAIAVYEKDISELHFTSQSISNIEAGSGGAKSGDGSVGQNGGIFHYFLENSNISLLDCIFEDSKISVDATSSVEVKWYLTIIVRDTNKFPVSFSDVKISDKDSNELFTGTTDYIGRVNQTILTEYIKTNAGNTYITPHTINVSKDSKNNETSITLDSTKTITIYLEIDNGDWIISEDVVRINETIILNGNLIILNGGNLTFKNVTLIMNCTKDGEFHIYVRDGGGFFIFDYDDDPFTYYDRSNITSENTDYEFGFLVKSGAEFVMRNSELSECGYDAPGDDGRVGLTIKTNDAIIENSDIHNNYYGIYLIGSSDNFISNNNIHSNLFDGIYFMSSNNNNRIVNNNIFNNGEGIYFFDSHNNQITNNNISNNEYGIAVSSSSNNEIINSSITDSIEYDIQLNSFSTLNLINCTFNKNNIFINDDNSELIVKWYLLIKVINKNSKPFPNADIRIQKIENGTYDENFTTRSDGHIKLVTLTEYIVGKSFKTYYSDYRIIAKNEYLKNIVDIEIHNNKEIMIKLIEWVVTGQKTITDEVIYLDGNLTIENGGILTFRNVTLIMNCSYDGQFHIEVKTGGEFNILAQIPSGDLDLTLGWGVAPVNQGYLDYYENIGTLEEPSFTQNDTNYPDVAIGYLASPTFADIDNDGDHDLYIGKWQDDAEIRFYENNGTNKNPSWNDRGFVNNSDEQMITVTSQSNPAFADLDGDGDFDLTVMDDAIIYFENIGDKNEPSWKEDASFFTGINAGIASDPYFIDTDDDGDLDFFIGRGGNSGDTGKILFYENIGNKNSPVWVEIGYLFDSEDDQIDVGKHATVAFGDLDSDGDYDLTIGNEDGKVIYYENIGNKIKPKWKQGSMFDFISVTKRTNPAFADLDGDGTSSTNGSKIISNSTYKYNFWVNNGSKFKIEDSKIHGCGFLESGLKGIDYDLIIGKDDGTLEYYENSGTISNPEWSMDNSVFTGIDIGDRSTPTVADLDNDGDYDLVIGDKNGGLNYFENIGNALRPVWEQDNSLFFEINVGLYSTPVFVDLDNDGDLDLTIGNSSGNLSYYENIGTSNISEWKKNDTIFNGIDVGIYSAPAFSDLDNDGDFDLIIGEHEGNLNYYENIGTRINPEWMIDNLMFTGIDVGLYSKPTFVNLDNDDDYDLIIGDYNGLINYYENTGNKTDPVWTIDNQIFSGIDIGDHSAVVFADLDFDGFTMKNRGLFIETDNTSIINSEFSNNYNGLIIASKNNTVFKNTFSHNNDCGLLFFNSSFNEINNNHFDSNNIGIRFSISNELIVNSTISNSVYSDFILKSSDISVLNTTFNKTKIDIQDSSIEVRWYLDIEIINKKSEYIDIVNLTIRYKNNEIILDKIVDHQVKWIDVIEYTQINDKKFYRTRLKLFGIKRTVGQNFTNLNITNSMKFTLTLIPYYDFEIYTDISEKYGDPGEFLSYEIIVENWCELNDTIILDFFAPGFISPHCNRTAVLLTGFKIGKTSLSFILPKDAIPDEFEMLIKATSLSNSSVSDEIMILTKINQVFELSLSSDKYIEKVNPGETISYEVHVINIGNVEDKINISISGIPKDWIHLNKDNFTLGIGDEDIIILDITIPDYLQAFDSMDFIFQAISTDGSNSTLFLGFTVNQIHQIDIISNEYSNSTKPGETISYIINITNKGNYNEAFNLLLTGENQDWGYLNQKIIKLERNQSINITLFVTPPYNALFVEKSQIFVETEILGIEFSSEKISTKVEQVNDISMEIIGESSKNINPGETGEFLIKFKNNGNGNEILNLKLSGEYSGWGDIINDLKLDVYEEKLIKLKVRPPNDSLAFETAEIIIEAYSIDVLLESVECQATVNQNFNIILETEINERLVYEDEIAEYTIEITNNGNGEDILLLKLGEENSEFAYFDKSILTMDAGESENITLFINPNPELKETIIEIYSMSKNGDMSNILTIKTILKSTENIVPNAAFKIIYKGKEINKIIVGNEITFDAGESFDENGNIDEFKWDFGNGEIRYGQLVSYIYPEGSEGNEYNITLTVTDNEGMINEENMVVEILPLKTSDSFEFDLIFIILIIIGIVIIIVIMFVMKSLKRLDQRMKLLNEKAAKASVRPVISEKIDIDLWKPKKDTNRKPKIEENIDLWKPEHKVEKEFKPQISEDKTNIDDSIKGVQEFQKVDKDLWKPKKGKAEIQRFKKSHEEDKQKIFLEQDFEDDLWKPRERINIQYENDFEDNNRKQFEDQDEIIKDKIFMEKKIEKSDESIEIDIEKKEKEDLEEEFSDIISNDTEIKAFNETQIEDLSEDFDELEEFDVKKDEKKKKTEDDDDWWGEWESNF